MDRRAVQVRAGGRLLRVRVPHRLQDRHQAARGRVRRQVHEQRPLRLEGDRASGAPQQVRPTLLLSGADVERLLTPEVCIAAVEDAFRQLAEREVPPPGILGMHSGEGSFHVKAGFLTLDRPYFAAKLNANFPHNGPRHGLPTISCAAGCRPRPRSGRVGSWTGEAGGRRRNRPYLSLLLLFSDYDPAWSADGRSILSARSGQGVRCTASTRALSVRLRSGRSIQMAWDLGSGGSPCSLK